MNKKYLFAAMAILAISILPGCGKSKNNETNFLGGPAGVYSTNGALSSSFAASGTLSMSNATGSVSGSLYAVSSASGAGTLYTRTNVAGDRLDLYVNGSAPYGTGYTPVQATVIVSLAQTTVSAFSVICGQGPVRAEFNYNILASGTLPSSVKLVAANGCYGNI